MQGVYLILDPDQTCRRPAVEVTEAALEAGTSVVQWRQKLGALSARWQEIHAVRDLCQRYEVPFLINDRVDVALAVQADGAHVGQGDLPAEAARRLMPGKILGVSVTRLEEVASAEAAGADYLGVGPVFPTVSKVDAAPVGGLDLLRRTRNATSLPLVAIGGITRDNAEHVWAAGADAIAVISAICCAANVGDATRALVSTFSSAGAP